MSGISDPSIVSPPRHRDGNDGVVPSRSPTPTDSQESLSLDDVPLPLSAELQQLKERLAPLTKVEQTLFRRLNPTGKLEFEGEEGGVPVGPTPDTTGSVRRKEIALNSTAWKGMVGRLLNRPDLGDGSSLPRPSVDVNDPCALQIQACAPDMIQLWNDPAVKDLLVRKKLRLEEVSGLYVHLLC
jgi:hypothetical protein